MKTTEPRLAEQPHQCRTCGAWHYVPSLARDCENRHKEH